MKYIVTETSNGKEAARIAYPANSKEDVARIVNNLTVEGYCEPKDLQIHIVAESYGLNNGLDLIPEGNLLE